MNAMLLASIWTRFTKAFIQENRWKMYLTGLGNTLLMAFFAILIGVTIGVLVALVNYVHKKTGKLKALSAVCGFYVTVIRGTPVVLQLFIMTYAVLATIDNGILAGVLTFGINSGAYVAEIVRAGYESVDDGQMEAGRSLGLSMGRTMVSVVTPQAVRNSLPPLFNEFISLVKETAIVGYIGVMDLGKVPSIINSRTFDILVPLLIAAVIYLAIVLLLTKLLRVMEKKLSRSDRDGGLKKAKND